MTISTQSNRTEFVFIGNSLPLDFCNTLRGRETQNPRELLAEYEDLVRWGVEAGVVSPARARKLVTLARRSRNASRRVLGRARRFRDAFYDVLARSLDGHRPRREAIERVNKEIRRALATLEVTFVASNLRVGQTPALRLDEPLNAVARSGLELVADRVAMERFRQCAHPTCSWLFVDTSPNGRRQWCEMAVCGNRLKVQRHYWNRKRARRQEPADG